MYFTVSRWSPGPDQPHICPQHSDLGCYVISFANRLIIDSHDLSDMQSKVGFESCHRNPRDFLAQRNPLATHAVRAESESHARRWQILYWTPSLGIANICPAVQVYPQKIRRPQKIPVRAVFAWSMTAINARYMLKYQENAQAWVARV